MDVPSARALRELSSANRTLCGPTPHSPMSNPKPLTYCDQVLFMLGASVLDQRTRYTTEVPQWAQPGALGFPLWRQILFMARTQLALLRPWHVVPGRTAYTRVQCVHMIFTSATLNCLGSLLFSQGQQCSVLATYTATVIAALTCSFPALLARLFFLPARDERTKRCYHRLTQEREQLFLLAGVAASPSKRFGKLGSTGERERMTAVLKSGDFPDSPKMMLPLHQLSAEGMTRDGPRAPIAMYMSDLPPKWSEEKDIATGDTYFWNSDTNETSWDRPIASPTTSPTPPPSPPHGGEKTSGGEFSAESLHSEGWSSGSRGGSMRTGGGEVHSVQLRPSQLVLLPDGTSIGFQAPGGNTSHKIAIVPTTRVGTPWRELRSGRFRVEHGAAGLQYLSADDLQAHHATAVLVGGVASNSSPPPLARWGCSAKLSLVWVYSGLLLLAGWFGLVLLARVALPRSCKLRGVSEDEAWDRSRSAMAFGLLNVFVILDSLKIVVLVMTGPGITSRIMRIKNTRLRFAVRQVVQTIHLPMALICP